MTVYTYSEARQNLATLLDKAKQEGEIMIRRKDGSTFLVRPVLEKKSPLDVQGVDLNLSDREIVDTVREIRRRP